MLSRTQFAEALGEIGRALAEAAPTHSLLNRAALQVDRLGRQLHGLRFPEEEEVAPRLFQAVQALASAHPLAEAERSGLVAEALSQMEVARRLVEETSLAPPRPAGLSSGREEAEGLSAPGGDR